MRQKLGDGLTLEIIILGLTRRNAGAHDPGLHAPLAEYGSGTAASTISRHTCGPM